MVSLFLEVYFPMVYILIGIGLLWCAIQAVRSPRLLTSALWLAGASALTALLMFLLGAPEVAVIELSVGAGLVTVLFVFAINIAGEEEFDLLPVVPRPVAWVLVVIGVIMLIWMNLSVFGPSIGVTPTTNFSTALWVDRRVDVLMQIGLIFAGVLGVLGLMADVEHPAPPGPVKPTKEHHS
jgi:uncharacterized MnhB-related membrane protein